MEKTIWVLAHREDHGDRGIVTELGYTGPYGSDTCPAFESEESAKRYGDEHGMSYYFTPMRLVVQS